MNMRETASGEAEARRQKATYEDYLLRNQITTDLPRAERMEKVAKLCRTFQDGAQRLSENLQPAEVKGRIGNCDGIPCTQKQMIKILEENEHVVGLMARCIEDMYVNPLSQVNGTSIMFKACSEGFIEQQRRLEIGRKALAGLLSSGEKSMIDQFTQKLTCATSSVLSFLLVIENMVAA
jgi:hypothetical protein